MKEEYKYLLYIEEAEESHVKKDYIKAIICCHKAIKIKPIEATSYKLLGNIFQSIGQFKEAEKQYLKAIKLQPNYAEVYANIGSLYANNQNWNQAISLYQTAINLKPDFIGAYCNLAKVWIKLGNLIEAAQVYYNVGKVKSQQNQNLEAISFYKKAIQLKSDQAEYYLALGDILKTQQQWDEAALAYDAAIKVDPKQAEAYFKQGIALSRLSQLYQAVSSYKKAIELNPNSYDYYHHLGDTFLCLKQYLNAIDAYEKSIELYPKYIWSYNNLGLTLSKIEQFERAVSCYKKAIYLGGNNPRIYSNLGYSLQKQEKWDEAINAYLKTIELDSNYDSALHSLGNILVNQGHFDLAIHNYKRAIDIRPNLFSYYQSLGNALAQQGKLDESIKAYRRAIELNPKSVLGYAKLGMLIAQQEEWSESISIFIEALCITPNNQLLYKQLGYVLEKLGRLDESQQCCRAIFPNSLLKEFAFSSGNIIQIASNSSATETKYIELSKEKKIKLIPTQTLSQTIHESFISHYKVPKDFVVKNGCGFGDTLNSAVITSSNQLLKYASTGNCELVFASQKLPEALELEGKVVFLSAKHSSGNYYHWMFHVIARLELIEASGFTLESIDKFVLHTCHLSFHQETLKILGIPDKKIIETRFYPFIKAEEMIVPSLSLPCPSIRSVNFLKNKFLITDREQLSTMIYISRKNASYRKVINENEVSDLLKNFGFTSVTLESMSVTQQASLMSSAQVVVSPHGAGLSNIIFCNPRTKIIEIFSPNYVHNFYHILSSYCDLEYYYLIGEEINDNRVTTQQDILVNTKKLKALIKLSKL
jgi:tetratricopeptide (TPR) repeat protein/capsular polysaccharide biosynthesis protein